MARVLCVLLHNLEKLPPQAKNQKDFLAKLLRWAYRLSPLVALDSIQPLTSEGGISERGTGNRASAAAGCSLPESWHSQFGTCVGLNLDISGTERLFRGERRLLARVQAELKSNGLKSRLSIAPTLGAAWALSRFSNFPDAKSSFEKEIALTVQPNAVRKHLEPLPIEALRLNSKVVRELHQLNVKQIKNVLALPRPDLYQRYGKELPQRINQALGLEEEVCDTVSFAPLQKAKRVFDSPLTERARLFAHLEEMLDEALGAMDCSLLKVSRLVVELKEIGRAGVCKEILLSLPTSDKKHLWKLLRAKLENVPVCEGIEAAGIYIPSTEPFASRNSSFIPPSANDRNGRFQPTEALQNAPFAQLIDSLREQLGKTNVLYLEPAATHIPEKVCRYIPATGRAPQPIAAKPALIQTDRPSILFYQPHPISAMAVLPDTPPFWLKWKDTTYRIITGMGPERVEPEWWGKDSEFGLCRDYFKVQLPCGTWLWIFREIVHCSNGSGQIGLGQNGSGQSGSQSGPRQIESGGWFLHGIWV